jgi:hypothetical protein
VAAVYALGADAVRDFEAAAAVAVDTLAERTGQTRAWAAEHSDPEPVAAGILSDRAACGDAVTIPAAMIGDPDLTITLSPDGADPWHPGKARYRWSVTDGAVTLSGDDLCGWGESADMARSLCAFLTNDLQCKAHAVQHGGTDADGDPLPAYSAEVWAMLERHSDTLELGSVEPGTDR